VRRGERTSLVLEGVEALATLSDLGDVLVHNVDGRVDLRLDVRDLRGERPPPNTRALAQRQKLTFWFWGWPPEEGPAPAPLDPAGMYGS
jgi:hypothetical protein